MTSAEGEEVLPGFLNLGQVVRVGDTVRRPRGAGADVVEALLGHLFDCGFAAAPRFLGVDEQGRQILEFVAGDVHRQPPWQRDDAVNTQRLGDIARLLRELHEATATFVPPEASSPQRPLPLVGPTWTHGDPGYPNIVYRGDQIAALIDWEFAAPGDALYDPASLVALGVRGPRVDATDNERREAATAAAFRAVADGYAMTEAQRMAVPAAAAVILEDTAEFLGDRASPGVPEHLRWRADWFRGNASRLVDS